MLVALYVILRVLQRPAVCEPVELYLLVLSPYPRPSNSPGVGWTGGPALWPAAQLAADVINNRTDILPHHTIKLINRDSGCAFPYRATVIFAREREDAKRNRRPFVGIVGPACSSSAMEVGSLTVPNYADVASITIATGPLLCTANLVNMLRLYSSAKLAVEALFQLMKQARWTSAAAIVDSSHWYYPQIYSSFRKLVTNSPSITVELLNYDVFSFIKNRYNVIVVFGGTRRSAETLCIARHLRLTFPDYQWILLDVELNELLRDTTVEHDRKVYNCNVQDMQEAAHKAIVFHLRLVREDKESKGTHSGYSYNEFVTSYEEYYSRHLFEEGIGREEVDPGSEAWAAAYFDAVWAFALAIHQSLQESAETPSTTSIHRHLLSLNFSGLTGESIHFDKNSLEVSSVLEMYQLDNKRNLTQSRVGSFYEGSFNISENAVFVDPIKNELIVVSHVTVAVFFTIGIIIFAVIAGVHIMYVVFRDCQSIRATSPHFVHIIFSGCYLYLLAALLETVRAANWTGSSEVDSTNLRIALGTLCNTIYWCLTLGAALIFGTMGVLAWRIYRIFSHFLNPGLWVLDPILASMVGALVAVHVSVLVAWSSYDPLLAKFVVVNEGLTAGILPYYQYCDCKYFNSWLFEWILNHMVICTVVVLSILNRHVPKKDYMNNTQSYNATVYIVSILNGLCIPVYLAYSRGSNIDKSYIIFQTFTLGTPLTALLLLFLPPLIPLFRKTRYSF